MSVGQMKQEWRKTLPENSQVVKTQRHITVENAFVYTDCGRENANYYTTKQRSTY